MHAARAWLPIGFSLLSFAAHAAGELGTVTVVAGTAQVLRGATWYKLAPGQRIEEGDIVAAADRAQAQLEFDVGTLVNVGGEGALLVAPQEGKLPTFVLPAGWLKIVVKPPGARVRSPALDIVAPDATAVVHAAPGMTDVFLEAGTAKLASPAGDPAPRDAKRGEFWSKAAAQPASSRASPPRAFVDAMPRHFNDPLPTLAAKARAKPPLVVDHEITYAEALPWLSGRDRVAFERRFAVRLRDPAFRRAAEADIARYPSWDRQLHPEKYAPKAAPVR